MFDGLNVNLKCTIKQINYILISIFFFTLADEGVGLGSINSSSKKLSHWTNSPCNLSKSHGSGVKMEKSRSDVVQTSKIMSFHWCAKSWCNLLVNVFLLLGYTNLLMIPRWYGHSFIPIMLKLWLRLQ